MLRAAREVTLIADSSKFGRRSLSIIGPIEALRRVITDEKISPQVADTLRKRNIELILV